jgi:small subunit ribosomal protein S10
MPTKKTTTKKVSAAKKSPVKANNKVASTRLVGGQAATRRGGGKAEAISKLRMKVRAYEHKILDSSVRQIMEAAARFDAQVQGPIPLPTEIRKYTVNRSAFVHKNAREQFEMRAHKRLIDIINPSPKLVEALSNISLPSGVNIEVKML